MPDLIHSLRGYDLGHLRIVADLWRIELGADQAHGAAEELARSMLDPRLAGELLGALPQTANAALSGLARADGRMPWAAFARQFGEVREMGAGRRDREKPYLKPASSSEVLFYRGLLARAFFDTAKGPQEFAYVPDDLLPVVRAASKAGKIAVGQPLGRGATPAERRQVTLATDRILDEATTYLAALRIDKAPAPDPVLRGLLQAAGLIQRETLQAAKVRAFLESPRPEALKSMAEAWRTSGAFNELRLIPSLTCEGEWRNEPLAAREFVLGLLGANPAGTWWSLSAFLDGVKKSYPDFQRPAGDYDSWFVRTSEGVYLRGFEHWDEVDGALIRFMIAGVMYRLGLLDVAAPAADREVSAFRLAGPETRGADYASRFPAAERAQLRIASRATIVVPRLVPRAARYQLARFCEWEEERDDGYRYRLTPESLRRAAGQGLKPGQLLALLAKHSDAGTPPALVKAIKRWEANGTEARVELQTVLRVSRPEILAQLRKSKAARYLAEPLGPTAVIVKSGAIQKVAEAMAELGVLMEERAAPPK